MKIWDKSALEETVFKSGKREKLSAFVGHPLTLIITGEEHQPFKCCSSYHNFMCFMKWSLHHDRIVDHVNDFSSDHEGSWLNTRQHYLDSLRLRIPRGQQEEDEGKGSDDDDVGLLMTSGENV